MYLCIIILNMEDSNTIKTSYPECDKECPECLGSGSIFNGEDYEACPKCKGNTTT
jgi:hypothetical protein